jgi:hypothetical protein
MTMMTQVSLQPMYLIGTLAQLRGNLSVAKALLMKFFEVHHHT